MTEHKDFNFDNTETSALQNTAPTPRSPLKAILNFIKEWVVILIFAAIGAWLCNQFLLMNTEVPTGSMVHTIPKPSRVISSRVHYWFGDPERGDVILFDPPFEQEYLYIKRVIGLPGETITIRDGLVYINDSATPLDEPYLADPPKGNYGPFQIPDGCYFVMGDNRNHSNDSRHWDVAYVPRDHVYAKAIFVYWPKFSLVK